MGKLYSEIDAGLRGFIEAQRMFFVSTAPMSRAGHVNVSPKGLDSFRVLAARQVGYVDYPGSGIETVAHIRENGRLTIMFCAFEGRPNILRLYGVGSVIEPGDPEFATLIVRFSPVAAVRAIVLLNVTRITDSCGFGVPLYSYQGQRDQLVDWSERKGPEAIRAYQHEKNAASIDGLAGLAFPCGD